MFNNSAIDICLGLVFIFLLYSLLVTILQEMFAQWFSLRARNLIKTIRRMLEDEAVPPKKWTIDNIFIDLEEGFKNYFAPFENYPFLKAFYEYPLIKYLGENRANSRPSYISPSNFSETIIHLLRGDSFDHTQNPMSQIRDTLADNKIGSFSVSKETLAYLKKLYVDANGDIERFRLNLESWYQCVMNRSTGWYKKQTETLLFFTGLAIGIAFNVDTIAITKILINNKTVRDQIAGMAVAKVDTYGQMIPVDSTKGLVVVKTTVHDPDAKANLKLLQNDAASMQNLLGLGWGTEKTDTACQATAFADLQKLSKQKTVTVKEVKELQAKFSTCSFTERSVIQGSGLLMFGGWVITALAISLGAPFWFDLLNKIVSLRGTGPKEGGKPTVAKNVEPANKRVG